jgi:hypothetical protein
MNIWNIYTKYLFVVSLQFKYNWAYWIFFVCGAGV